MAVLTDRNGDILQDRSGMNLHDRFGAPSMGSATSEASIEIGFSLAMSLLVAAFLLFI